MAVAQKLQDTQTNGGAYQEGGGNVPYLNMEMSGEVLFASRPIC